jgi:alkanesulfonate monooxygenase SsuD/methylene tetrahydromethanopterin reductase-like flavin-dependent oxidoreductase (luciferase family)
MGSYVPGGVVEPLSGTADEIADTLHQFADAGASHIQLVVDPITADSIERLGDVLAHIRYA